MIICWSVKVQEIAEKSVAFSEEIPGSVPADLANSASTGDDSQVANDSFDLDFDLDSLLDDLDVGDGREEMSNEDGYEPSQVNNDIGWLVKICPLDNALNDGGESSEERR